ncbi:ribulose-phosphate 3-epimerase [Neorhodopirellula lusitana]|uniref:Ribulose-phosphate 3-epimerase n=1 Tax=Neorhodopirellula lusitana TaxID=445327 RepID=A0ABY1PRY2_9BACT|nr:ribulose-phosphate 3-epimerase [Neorhodopirellula lusitana]SMP40781.1 ribulose-phosphate 3-epimerase [Neorhodopirellula lusitana]
MSRAKLDVIRDARPSILPSLLQCDFGNLQGEVERLAAAGTQVLHLDVMDGHFVPNLSFGMPIVEGLRRHTDMPLDVHLMISDPVAYAKPMVDAGADLLTFHVEAMRGKDAAETKGRIENAVGQIRDLGVGVGLAINPSTPMNELGGHVALVDLVLVMSVEAGFGGQQFNPVSLTRIQEIRAAFPNVMIEIDGGIKASNIGAARQAGCDLFVVGSAITDRSDYGEAIVELNEAMLAGAQPAGTQGTPSEGESR